MTSLKPIKGLYTALTTPFKKNDQLDEEGLKKNIHFQLENGVDGLLLLGTTAETPTLTLAEKESILEIAKKECNTLPLMVGTGTNNTKTTLETTIWAADHGATSALVVSPYYNKPPQRGLLQHFLTLADHSPLPLILYNIPSRTSVKLEIETLMTLAQHPNIVGIKEASGSVTQMSDLLYALKKKSPDFSVLSGDDALTLPLMALGGQGVVSVVSNVLPKKMKELVTACEKGNASQAATLHYSLHPLFKACFIETNPIPIKAAMNLVGLSAGPVRLPLSSLNPIHLAALKTALAK